MLCVLKETDLQWISIGPVCLSCLTWAIFIISKILSADSGTPWSGQAMYWNCDTTRLSCTWTKVFDTCFVTEAYLKYLWGNYWWYLFYLFMHGFSFPSSRSQPIIFFLTPSTLPLVSMDSQITLFNFCTGTCLKKPGSLPSIL